ncbi:MAG: nucleotide exchange factor GrpE, partial [candidate division KSB1 bacterium]|nr:nucleotide exchange factor GrpE [candidate division KSB1 bacterium]
LELIETVGRDFDPTLHEALSIEEVSDEKDGKILEEWQKGYLFKGRLLRAARVKVGKKISVPKSGDH